MKRYIISMMFILLILTGCEALGIKQADNASNENSSQGQEKAAEQSVSFDNQMSASSGQNAASEEILNLQKEIDELVSAVNAKDIALTELENKLKLLEDEKQQTAAKAASVEAELVDLKDSISTNNQYRNIAIIVALISLLLNILLAYIIIRSRMRNKRAALPPAKNDIQSYNEEVKVDKSVNSSDKSMADSQPDVSSTVSEDAVNSTTATKANETEISETKKRGRPKAADKQANNTDKPAAKRGRPKKEKSE